MSEQAITVKGITRRDEMRRKRTQREEVRKILAAVRAELAAQKHYGLEPTAKRPVVHLNDVITRARASVRHG